MKTFKQVGVYGLLVMSLVAVGLSPAQADMSSEMNKWFDSSSYANGVGAGAYKSQIGGYYTGGNVSVRVPTKTVGNFGSIQLPSAKSGCGGIDLDLGGFNLVNKDQIVQQLRAIGQNAKALAFSMAIKYVSSLLGSTMDTVKEWADKLNGMQMDSCSAAANIMQFAGDMITGNEEKNVAVCIQIQASKNNLSYDQARRTCTSGGGKMATLDGEGSKRVFSKGNMAWFAMMQVPWLKTDLELAQLLMNITGTTIMQSNGSSDPNEETRAPMVKAPLALDGNAGMETLMSTLIFGQSSTEGYKGKIKIFKCDSLLADELSCVTLKNGGERIEYDLSTITGIKDKLKERIESIYTKVHDKDATLDATEKAMIETVKAPLYRYILVSATAFNYTDGNRDSLFNTYLDGLARDLMATNLQSVFTEIAYHMDIDKLNPNLDENKKNYYESIKNVMGYLAKVKDEAKRETDYALEMQSRAQQYERIITSRLSAGTFAATQFR